MVCSNWAVKERSLVTTVQPSSHISHSCAPIVTIGSTVNVMFSTISSSNMGAES